MLSLNNVALRRGADLLFDGVTFTIHRGNKVGLIGANGTGKSSLFQAILSNLDLDLGVIDLPAGTRIAHMAQEVAGTSQPAREYVLGGDQKYADTMAQLTAAEQAGEYENLATLHETLDAIDGYAAPSRAEQLLAGLGFSQDEMTKPLADFSGGWRIRLNLARTLMSPSDLLLLDEPTNHLDMDAIIWLADWLRHYPGTLLLISHDREFLDECVDHIAYLHNGSIELFRGNYSRFEVIKAERLALQQASYEKQQREIAHMQDFVRRFRAKASKAKQAQSRIKALERMELIAPAHVDSPFSFEISATEKVSTPLLTLSDATLGYDKTPVLEGVSLSLLPGDQVGLLGVNGAGKSTLIRTIRGELPLLAGERIEGANLSIAYFSQHQLDTLDLDQTALQQLTELGRSIELIPGELEARNFLGGFNFHGDKVKEPVRTFSGGEKARLALALIAYTKPNLLLMDEPTNHLDIDMRQALSIALQTFIGALVLVSHDRHLIASTVDQFLLIEAGRLVPFKGDLDDYRRRVLPATEPEAETQVSPEPVAKPRPGKQTRQIKTRIRTLDTRIDRLQRKLAEVETSLADPGLFEDPENPDLQPLLREQLELSEQLEELENEWLELNDELEQQGLMSADN